MYADYAAYHRQHCRGLSNTDTRHFIAGRLERKPDAPPPGMEQPGDHIFNYYLDSPERLAYGCTLSLTPHANTRRQVCQRYFVYMCNTSNSQIYQPEITTRDFDPNYRGGQKEKVSLKPLKSNGVVTWILALAALYQQDPTSDHIYLPFANKRVVFLEYQSDWLAGEYRNQTRLCHD